MSDAVEQVFGAPVYGLPQADKSARLLQAMIELTEHHRTHCPPYAAILAAQGEHTPGQLSDLPFLPVRLFKQHVLESIPPEERFKVLTSSGTTGQAVSRIALDRTTSANLVMRQGSSGLLTLVHEIGHHFGLSDEDMERIEAEVGMPDYVVSTWYGVWAPKGTPADAQSRAVEEIRRACLTDEAKAVWLSQGADFPNLTGAQFDGFIKGELRKWAQVVKASGAKLD